MFALLVPDKGLCRTSVANEVEARGKNRQFQLSGSCVEQLPHGIVYRYRGR